MDYVVGIADISRITTNAIARLEISDHGVVLCVIVSASDKRAQRHAAFMPAKITID